MNILPKSRIFLSKILPIVFLLVMISASLLHAQHAPSIKWQKCLGGTNLDIAKCIIQTSDGGYAIAGYTASTDGDIIGSHRIQDNKYVDWPDVWVVKLNSSGSIEWQKCLGGIGSDYAYSIIQTTDGGYAIAGNTDSGIGELYDGDVSGNHGYEDAWVVKLDSLGNIEWQKCYGGRGSDLANCIIQTTDGGYIIAGFTSSVDGDVIGNHNAKDTTGYYYGDAWIVKLSASGMIEWQKCLGGTGYDEAQSIVQATGGGYVIAGSTTSIDGDVSGKHAGSRDSAADAWVVKLSSSGSIEWQKCLGGTSNDYAYSIVKTFDGGYAVAGKTNSNNGDVSGFHPAQSYGDYDAWVVKLNSLGSIQWQKCLGGNRIDIAFSIIQTADKGYVIAGETGSENGDVSGNHGGSRDVWVVKLDTSANILWQKCFGGSGTDEAYSVINTSDGGYAFAGWAEYEDGDVYGLHINNLRPDAWVVKLNDASSSVDITNTDFIQQKFFWIYPNPSTEQVHLELLQSLQLKQVQFYDIMGIQHYPDYRMESSSALVDIHTLSNGTYLTRVTYIRKGVPGTFMLPFIVAH